MFEGRMWKIWWSETQQLVEALKSIYKRETIVQVCEASIRNKTNIRLTNTDSNDD